MLEPYGLQHVGYRALRIPMMRQIMALFDEYQSKENAKHTLRAMRENARQGFWNGLRPPFGYCVVAAEMRGARTKKKLEVDPAQAEHVRLMFRLVRIGDGQRGPLGANLIADYLHQKGIRTSEGGRRRSDADRTEARAGDRSSEITDDAIRCFAGEAKRRMRTADGGYRRHHLQALAQRIEVGDATIRITGTKSKLLRVLAGGEVGPPHRGAGHSSRSAGLVVETTANGVRNFVPNWLPEQDSNLRPFD